jgi:hypothetical protein
MGADVVYTYRKLMPRLFIFALLWSVTVFVPFMVNLPSWSPFYFAADFAAFLLYLSFEFYHASTLTRGAINNISIGDLTKAIYWLSVIGSGEVPGQEFSYQKRAAKVISKIDGDFQTIWDGIVEKHNLPDPTRNLLILIGVFVCSLGTVAAYAINEEMLSNALAVFAVISLIGIAINLRKGRENLQSFVSAQNVSGQARSLVQELILWVSVRTQKPVKVMLAGNGYSNVRAVGSVYGTVVVEIEPKGVSIGHDASPEHELGPIPIKSTSTRNVDEWSQPLWYALVLAGFVGSMTLLQLSIPLLNSIEITINGFLGGVLSLIFAIITVSLPFIPIELLFRKKHITSSIPAFLITLFILLGVPTLEWIGLSEKMAWMSFFTATLAVSVVGFGIMLYFGLPLLRIAIRGGVIMPSDLEDMARRYPAWIMKRSLRQNTEALRRFEFLVSLQAAGKLRLSDSPEFVRQWVVKDSKQPEKLRYFQQDGEYLSLTELGDSVGTALTRKLSNFKSEKP